MGSMILNPPTARDAAVNFLRDQVRRYATLIPLASADPDLEHQLMEGAMECAQRLRSILDLPKN